MDSLSREIRKKLPRGDKEAFRQAVDLHSPWLYKVCYNMVYEHHQTLDMVQEVFLYVYEKIDRYDGERPFGPWFRTVALRKALNVLRKTKSEELTGTDFENWMEGESEGVDRRLKESENREEMNRALNALPFRYRIPLVLMYKENRSVAEIARWMDSPENTIKTWLRRGRQALKEKLKSPLWEEEK